jgi:hypothetical protein
VITDKTTEISFLYRFTFIGEDGTPWKCQFEESNLPAAFHRLEDMSQLIKIERIKQFTGKPVADIYDE